MESEWGEERRMCTCENEESRMCILGKVCSF